MHQITPCMQICVPSFSGLNNSQIASSLKVIPDNFLFIWLAPVESEVGTESSFLIIRVGSRKHFSKLISPSENFKSLRVFSNKEINCGLHFCNKEIL